MKSKETIVREAFRKIGVPGDEDSLTEAQELAGLSALDSLIRHWNGKHGLPLWKTTDMIYNLSSFTTNGQSMGIGATLPTTTKPLKIKGAWRMDYIDEDNPVQVPMHIYERQRFNDLSNINITGAPANLFQEYLKDTINVYIWPLPDTYWQTNGSLRLTVVQAFQIDDDDETFPDFPDYWEQAVIYNLAKALAPEYGLSMPDRQLLIAEAKEYLNDALDFDGEEGSIFIRPKRRR